MWDTILAALSPLLNQAVIAAFTALLAFGALAVNRLADWARVSADSKVREYFLDALENALNFAEAEARRRLPQPSQTPPILAAEMAGIASVYLKERVPDALKRLGVDDPGLGRLIQSRLADRLPFAVN